MIVIAFTQNFLDLLYFTFQMLKLNLSNIEIRSGHTEHIESSKRSFEHPCIFARIALRGRNRFMPHKLLYHFEVKTKPLGIPWIWAMIHQIIGVHVTQRMEPIASASNFERRFVKAFPYSLVRRRHGATVTEITKKERMQYRPMPLLLLRNLFLMIERQIHPKNRCKRLNEESIRFVSPFMIQLIEQPLWNELNQKFTPSIWIDNIHTIQCWIFNINDDVIHKNGKRFRNPTA
ncbi:hypothetical protein BIW19_00200 [Pseudomonas putida]|nr:hypothetical protein BIW19_00200 [Pseudomonas putida]